MYDSLSFSASNSPVERAAMFGIGGIGVACNCLLVLIVLCQRHTRRTSSAFILHSCALNCVLACLSVVFGLGLEPNGLSGSSCNRFGTLYILFMTTSVFNLVAVTCCEVYAFDNCSQALKKTPRGSFCCVLFAIVLVYTGSIILHLGPTLIGASFQTTSDGRCLLLYGQTKNYIVYTMWILIVSIALAAASYYLVIFYRVIDKTVEAKLIIIASRQDEISVELAEVEKQLDKLAELKHNRQRVLAVSCGLHIASWYPVFFLLLADPQFRAPPNVYKALTLLGFLKCGLEPLALLLFDSSVNHWLLNRLPWVDEMVTESQVNRWLRQLEPAEQTSQKPQQSQSDHPAYQDDVEDPEVVEEELDEGVSSSIDWQQQSREYRYHSPFSSVQQQRRHGRPHSPITLV